MAGIVKLVLQMDDQGTFQAMQQVEGQMNKLPPALERVGSKGNMVFTQLRHDQEKARDATNLLARTIGAEIPRSLERVIARSAAARTVMASLFNIAVVAGFAAVIANFAVEGIGKLIEWWNRAEDAKNKALEIDQQRANKLLVESLENTRQLRLRAALAGADDIRAVEIKLNEDLKNLRERMDQVKVGDKPAIRQLLAERIALERAAAADIGVIHEKQARESAKVRMEADIAAIKFWLDAEKEASDEIKARRKEAVSFERQIQDENVALAIQGLEGEERVNAELTAKIANLEEVKRKYEEFPNIVANATGQEILLQENAAREILTIRRQQAEQMARDWQMAVHHMASQIERFLDNPLEYLKNLWKRFLAEMVASWILSTSAMSGQRSGAGQGGFSLGGMLGGLFGLGGGGGGSRGASTSGGGFSLPNGFSTSSALPTTRPGGFGSLGSLGGLPMSGGGGVSAGTALGAGSTRLSLAGGLGQLLKANAPMLALAGGAALVRSIGFGSPVRGAISGGLIGGGIGFLFGGPLGAILGAAAGALIGLFMRGNKRKKRDDLERQWFRAIEEIENAYKFGKLDYMGAVGQFEQLRQSINEQMRQFGWPSRMNPHIDAAIGRMNATEAERQRRQNLQFGPAQFERGGFIQGSGAGGQGSGFGPLGIPLTMPSRSPFAGAPRFDSGGAVPIIAHAGEFVMRRSAVQRIGRGNLEAMNASGSGGGGNTIVIQAWDGPSVEQWLRNGGAKKIQQAFRRGAYEGGL